MDDEVNPAANPELHGRAEDAALEAYKTAGDVTDRELMRRMDRAARKVFKQAGTPAEQADFFACAVTSLVLSRVSRE